MNQVPNRRQATSGSGAEPLALELDRLNKVPIGFSSLRVFRLPQIIKQF